MPMKKTAIFIPEDQQEQLQILSDLHGAVFSELIRRAIGEYLEKREQEIAEARKAKKGKSR
jgi:predicted DNA-binding protein